MAIMVMVVVVAADNDDDAGAAAADGGFCGGGGGDGDDDDDDDDGGDGGGGGGGGDDDASAAAADDYYYAGADSGVSLAAQIHGPLVPEQRWWRAGPACRPAASAGSPTNPRARPAEVRGMTQIESGSDETRDHRRNQGPVRVTHKCVKLTRHTPFNTVTMTRQKHSCNCSISIWCNICGCHIISTGDTSVKHNLRFWFCRLKPLPNGCNMLHATLLDHVATC